MDDRLIIRTPGLQELCRMDLALEVYGPDIRDGIVPFIEHFGKLYHAKLRKETWQDKFIREKKHMIENMWGACDDPGIKQNIDFKLNHIALARTTNRWNFPVLLDVRNNSVKWINGHSRLLASSISWIHAWDTVDFLIMVQRNQDLSVVEPLVQNLSYIGNDTDLRTVLGDHMSEHEPSVINAVLETETQPLGFRLSGIYRPTDLNHSTANGQHIMQWQAWRSHHLDQDLTLHASAISAATITDSSNRWKLQYLGPPPDQLISWAQMSASIFNDKQNGSGSKAWCLYHFGVDPIDLAELFFYVDLTHSVLHTHNWQTILVQPGNFFKCKEISLSGL